MLKKDEKKDEKKDKSSEFLKSQFPSRNTTIQWFNKKFCDWKWFPVLIKDEKNRGKSAPLWKNKSPDQYRVFYTLNLIFLAVFVLFFSLLTLYNISRKVGSTVSDNTNSTSQNSTLSNSTTGNSGIPSSNNQTLNSTTLTAKCFTEIQTAIKPDFIIIGSVILLVNGKNIFTEIAAMARFLSRIVFASDEEWFRYLVLNLTCCVTLGLFNFFEYFDFKDKLSFYNSTLLPKYSSVTQCIIFFNVNLWSTFMNTVSITVVCGLQIIMIVNNFQFYFLRTDDDKLAIIKDEDLMVYEA